MAPATVKYQMNVRLEPADISKIRKLAIQFDSTLDAAIEVAIKQLLRTPRKELARIMDAAPKKISGPKIKS
jgi:hypothetical protein